MARAADMDEISTVKVIERQWPFVSLFLWGFLTDDFKEIQHRGVGLLHHLQNGNERHNLHSPLFKCRPQEVRICVMPVLQTTHISLQLANLNPEVSWKASFDQPVPVGGILRILENCQSAADLRLDQTESRVGIQEGQKLLHEVRIVPELLLCIPLLDTRHLLEQSV